MKIDATKLSDFHLFSLNKNVSLNARIRTLILEEMTRRNFDHEYEAELLHKLQEKFGEIPPAGLTTPVKALIIAIPFIGIIILLVATKFVTNNKIWNQYWYCVSIALGLWSTGFILLTRF